jgi:molybdopterin-guanine dinucleotide biosynthesis protein A
MRFSAVILAGGKSSRMGRDKAWLEVDGKSLLGRQIQLVRAIGAHEVFISGRTEVDYAGFDCPVLRDRLVDVGPLGGIERALTEASAPLVLVLAVDMPRMTPQFLRELLLRSDDGVGVIPRVNGEIEPLAAFYQKISVNLITEIILASKIKGSGDESLHAGKKSAGARAFAEKCVERGLAKFVEVGEAERKFFTNWNSPEDVKQENQPDFIG